METTRRTIALKMGITLLLICSTLTGCALIKLREQIHRSLESTVIIINTVGRRQDGRVRCSAVSSGHPELDRYATGK
jgi:hypothetical protein